MFMLRMSTILSSIRIILFVKIANTGSQFTCQEGDSMKPLPQDDPVRRKPDITKAKLLLNWEPTVQLNEGLEMKICYFKNPIMP